MRSRTPVAAPPLALTPLARTPIMRPMADQPPGASEPQHPGGRPPSTGRARFLRRAAPDGAGEAVSTVGSAAGIVALGFLGSRLLGVLRSMAIAHAFGTDPDLSAYWVAFRLPDAVFQVLAGATLASAFIPSFTRTRLRGGEAEAWRLASSVLNLVSLVTVALALLAFALAPVLVPLLAPGLGAESGRQAELRTLAVQLTRVMLLSPVLFGVSGMITGILNARQHFLAPALAPMIYNAAIILAALALAPAFGVRGLALGVVVGSAGHLAVQIPALRRVGMRWRPVIDMGSPAVREVARLAGPRIVGLAAAQVNFLVVTFFASYVSDAAIAAISYAFLVAMLPVGVIGMAISTALFPTLAEHAATRQLETLRTTVGGSLRLILFLAIPVSVALILLAGPGVRLLLEHGAFTADSTALVVGALVAYGLGIFALNGIEILSRGFYALADTRTPVQWAVLAVLLNVALCAALVAPFGIRGLAAAGSAASILEFGALLMVLDRRVGGLDLPAFASTMVRTVAASIVLGEVAWLTQLALRLWGVNAGTSFGSLVVLVGAGVAGGIAFVLAAWAMRIPEYRLVAARVRALI